MTVAHREMCRIVMDGFDIDKLYVIPTIVKYHRMDKYYWLNDDERVGSCRFMLDSLGYGYSHKWRLLDDEIRLKNLCHMTCSGTVNEVVIEHRRFIHTLLDFIMHHEYARSIVLVLGTDSFQNFTNWYCYKDILALISGIIVFQGRDGAKVRSPIEESVKVWHVEIPSVLGRVSASKVRERYMGKERGDLNHYVQDVLNLDNKKTTLKKLGWI